MIKSKSFRFILGFSLLGVALGWYLDQRPKSSKASRPLDVSKDSSASQSPQSQSFAKGLSSESPKIQLSELERKKEELVNKYLKETHRKIEERRIDSRMQALKGQILGPSQRPQNSSRSAFEESKGHSYSSPGYPDGPDQAIQNQMFNDQLQAQQDEEYRREYVKRFLENARQQGYEIQLDKDYRVISIKEIQRQPAQE